MIVFGIFIASLAIYTLLTNPQFFLSVMKQAIGLMAIGTALAFLLVKWAGAEPLPQPKPLGPGGSCPFGYTTSGSFCVPTQGAQDAVPKPTGRTCPFGWTSSGNYCLRSGSGGR
jgi:hypothetical protein